MKLSILAILIIILLSGCISSEQKEARAFVTDDFKDPTSVQFRNEVFKDGSLCGEINSKNSYGAYVGFKKFVSIKDSKGRLGGTEESPLKGRLDFESSSKNLREMGIKTYFMTAKIRSMYKNDSTTPLDVTKLLNAPIDETLKPYQQFLENAAIKITPETSENDLNVMVKEVAEPIFFEHIWNKYCPSSSS